MNGVVRVNAHVIDPDAERCRLVEAMMREHLSRDQMHLLRDALEEVFAPQDRGSQDNEHYLAEFIRAKTVENLSRRTIKYYEETLRKLLEYMGKPVRMIDASDIRRALSWGIERGCSPVTVNNERRCLSTFFQWLENEDVIRKSPVKRVKSLKEEKVDKKPFSDEEIERIRDSCNSIRAKAIVELLLSSGMRVSEMCGLDRDDIDLNSRECEVLGKGSKRRTCYFSAAAKLYIARYLGERVDDNPALFVSANGRASRCKPGGIETMMRKIGKSAGVSNVHPHRFRRTFATNNLRRGMRLEEIQQLLGHENMDTTLIYAKVDHELLKVNARRLS